MVKREDAARACENKRPKIDGRIANVNLAYLGAKPKSFPKGKQSKRVYSKLAGSLARN